MSRTLRRQIVVGRPPEEVFDFLSRLENHWEVSGRRLVSRYEPVDERTQRVLFGPPGARRWATSRLDRLERPRVIDGTARTARSDGAVRWRLEPRGDQTLVRLEMELRPQPLDDRLLSALCAGWMERQLGRALARLRERLERPPASDPAGNAILVAEAEEPAAHSEEETR